VSPLVTHLEWGRIDVVTNLSYKDVKLSPEGSSAWDWRETGTRHVPGIQIGDVNELVQHGCRIIILSRGMNLVLRVPAETIAWLTQQEISVEVMETRLAVARYNELRGREKVGALIHSTC
jgi:hypothetical protein